MKKRYRPKPVHLNALQRAIEGARKLERQYVVDMKAALDDAFHRLKIGDDPKEAWKCLADSLNVGEALADLGICSDEGSRSRLQDGHNALRLIATRQQRTGSWALYPAEINHLGDAIWIHTIQLEHASLSEFERAHSKVV